MYIYGVVYIYMVYVYVIYIYVDHIPIIHMLIGKSKSLIPEV